MPADQREEQQAGQERQDRPDLSALIGRHVLRGLGRAGSLQRVQVRQLWGGHYRVNVFSGGDLLSARVAHSYFVVADGDGNVLESTPALDRPLESDR
jgi:hypothetical protein